ncbi:MAG: TVP38/TMEM64 family protein [Rhodobacteraceae bacterium]|nr:MAG: TVP38/TMEM64 family protein [Paracoccaceae bacterium]
MARDGAKRITLRRAAPLAAIVAGAVLAGALFADQLSFAALERNREALLAWRDRNYAVAALSYVGVYALSVTFSVPGALWLTLAGGFLFGVVFGAAFAVTGATIGAVAIFLAAKHGLGDALRARAGGWVKRMERGFAENQVGVMLAMRLVPVMPFFVANLVPAFLGARTWTYVWTTFVGIIPGGAVYASVGAGLGEVFARGERPDLGVIFEWPVLGPLLGLAALALLPTVWRAVRRKPAES